MNLQDKDGKQEDEQEHLDKLKYLRMKKLKGHEAICIRDVIKTPVNDRSLQYQFFLRMHLKCEVAYFFEFDRHTLENISKVMEVKTFEKGEVIYHKGGPPIDMYVLLFGEVGLFAGEILGGAKPSHKIRENGTFGEKALDSMEPRAYTSIALKPTTCLVLTKEDYAEKVFYLEHQKKQERLEYLRTKQPVLTSGWTEQKCRDLNAMMTQQTFCVGDTIYKMGDSPDYFYILLKGALSMTTVVRMTDVNQFPTGQNKWESYTTDKQV